MSKARDLAAAIDAVIRDVDSRYAGALRGVVEGEAPRLLAAMRERAGDVLRERTGELEDGFRAQVTGNGGALTLLVGNVAPYARIQELGGVIRAEAAPWLTFQLADSSWRRSKLVILPARPYALPALLVAWPDLLALPLVALRTLM